MRYFFPLLFLCLTLVAFQTWISHPERADPSSEAMAFLADIKSGNLTKVIRHFGGNTCRCPARNGWGAFLAYQPGQETNLAFLLGRPFVVNQGGSRKIESPNAAKFAAPFEQPEDYVVNLCLSFDCHQYCPFFLPLPMAYGKSMTWQELQDFIKDPTRDAAKGFSLRLRPAVTSGAIKLDTSSISPNVLGEFKFLQPEHPILRKVELKNKQVDYSEKIKAILAESVQKSDNQYITPQDAGPVIMPDSSKLSLDKLTEILPRLKSTEMMLHVVRRGKFQPWTIFHFVLKNSILEENNGAKSISLHN